MNATIQKTRERIATIKEQLLDLKSGSVRVPKQQAIDRLDAWLGNLQEEGAKRLQYTLNAFTLPDHRQEPLTIRNDPLAIDRILAAVVPDILRARMIVLLSAQYADGEPEVAIDQIPVRIAELESELLKLERKDFDASSAANIPQRSDVDPRVILDLDHLEQ